MKIATYLVIAASLLLFTACTRSAMNEPELKQYVITNNLDKQVIVRIQDSSKQLDGIEHITIPAHSYTYAFFHNSNATRLIPTRMEEPAFTYYWATEDFTMSDWYSRPPSAWKEKKYTTRPHKNGTLYSIDINPVRPRHDMKYCLNGMDGHTKWEVSNAYNANGVSVWDTLPANRKSMRVILDYNRTGSLYSHGAGEAFFNYDLVDSSARFLLKNNGSHTGPVIKTANYLRMTNDLRPSAPLHTESLDMLYMTLGSDKVYYLLVKQK